MLIHSYKTKKYGMGFGDFIRGSISCYQLCKIFNIPLVVDFKHHPIGKWIECPKVLFEYESSQILDLQDIRRFTVPCLKYMLIKKFKDIKLLRKKNAYIYTNVWPRFPLSIEEKDFIKSFLIPNDELVSEINRLIAPEANYEIIHIRSGDSFAFKTQVGEIFERSMDQIMQAISVIHDIKASTHYPLIVMSDSKELKDEIAKQFGIMTLGTDPVHCAIREDGVKDTLIDYFIMTRAKHIHQFSVHHWGSGFSDTINWVYDVPISTYKI